MRIMGRRRLSILFLTLCGTIVGAVAGLWLGRAAELHSARRALADYSYELTVHAEEMGAELRTVFQQLNSSATPYCSDGQIQAMQAETFQSRNLKDIGRTHDGKLYCSAFLGRLPRPYLEGDPALTLSGGVHVYTNVAVVLASFNGNRATVIESGDADAVLSPTAFDRWDRPNVRYMIAAVNRATTQVVPIAGQGLGIDAAQVLAKKRNSTNAGVIYYSRCSATYPVCAVTAENIADVWRTSRALQLTSSAMGAFGGFGFAFALALLYLQRTTLSHQLHRDIRRNAASIRMVYQPIVDVSTQRCTGAEALVRWTDQDGKAVSPDVFVRIAEEKEFIGELTALVIGKSIQETAPLLRENPDMVLSINIAASDMKGDELLSMLNKHVEQADIHSGQVALELTERSTADLPTVRSAILRLREQGFHVHIDDFGTGFSSLSYLGQLAVDAIKIDRSFTQAIGTDAVTAPILPQILAMAECLQLRVIVEGVETEMQMQFLEAAGKRLSAQGWYFSKPMSAEALATFLRKSHALKTIPAEHEAVAHSS